MEKLFKDLLTIDLQGEIVKLIENCTAIEESNNQKTWWLDNSQVTIGKTPDGSSYVYYLVSKKNTAIDDFKKYLEELDNDIFVSACENYEMRFGEKSLNKLNSLLENPTSETVQYINSFKESVIAVVKAKMEMLNKYLND